MRKYNLFLTAACSTTLIVFATAQPSATDSVKISTDAARVFIREHYNYPLVQIIADSTARQYANCREELALMEQELNGCNDLNKAQQALINSDSTMTYNYKQELKHANRWRVIWLAIADVTGITAATEAVVIWLKK